MDPLKCKAEVWGGWHSHQCYRKAAKDGYCKQHHPDTIKARKEAADLAYEEKRKKDPWYLLQQADARIADLEKELAFYKNGNVL